MANQGRERRAALPTLSAKLEKAVRLLNRLFDWLYHSKYNPIYRSGTLAVGFLIVLIVTGLYLCFFYSVGKPYQSIEEIQGQVWFGRWIRALHRYATDGALIATFFHIIQLLAQGKTWGPRTLAWISGVVMISALLFSAWSGYVMVWDEHGQLLALAGAKMLQTVPFLTDVLGVAFNGSMPVTESFFFMNLFLHVAIPLGMFFILWVHTAKLARTVWFPEKRVFWGALIAFFVLSVSWPAALAPEADLLKIIGRLPLDIFYGFWLPAAYSWSSEAVFAGWGIASLVIVTVPWWWRPSRSSEPGTSVVDIERCSGCTQCVRDCPYEAISMVPRSDGKRLIAEVSPGSCVSCGICAASCDDRAIGPPDRTANEQIAEALKFVSTVSAGSEDVIVIFCFRNGAIYRRLESEFAGSKNYHLYPVECCGTVHSDTLELLLEKVGGIFLFGCAARNCQNRDGLVLLSERIFEKRVPFLSRGVDRRRLYLSAGGDGEVDDVADQIRNFQATLKQSDEKPIPVRYGSIIRRTIATAIIVFLIGWGSQVEVGSDVKHGLIRLGARIPGRVKESCRPITEEEKMKLPVHMQRPEICESVLLAYNLEINVDGKVALSKVIKHSGVRGDSPIFMNEEVQVSPGAHEVEVTLTPTAKDYSETQKLSLKENITSVAGRIVLISYNSATSALELK